MTENSRLKKELWKIIIIINIKVTIFITWIYWIFLFTLKKFKGLTFFVVFPLVLASLDSDDLFNNEVISKSILKSENSRPSQINFHKLALVKEFFPLQKY